MVFIETVGFWWSWRPYTRLDSQPDVRPPTTPETHGFNETTTGFNFLLQKIRETPIFRPSFTENRQEKIKKYEGVSTETLI